MSYDLWLRDPATGDVFEGERHNLAGGTYQAGGTNRAWLNVTYNYGSTFYRLLGEKGIRVIYGMTGAASAPILREAAAQLSDEIDPDYWKAADGNVKAALLNLAKLADLFPTGIWDGD